MFLEISQNSQQDNTCTSVSFLIKLQAFNFIKKQTLAQTFSFEFCEISKNTFSYRTDPVAASHISENLSLEMHLYSKDVLLVTQQAITCSKWTIETPEQCVISIEIYQ